MKIYEKYPILIKAINYININNTESNHLPYHGIDHLFSVFQMCYEIVFQINRNPNTSEKVNHELELYIAALFHDYAHSGGKLNDNENIKRALNGLFNFWQYHKNEFSWNIVSDIIKATEYPYTLNDSELKLFEQKIIRDADMCYLFQPLSIVKLYNGLRTEFNADYKVFLDNQFKFLNGIKFYTEYHNNLWVNSVKEYRIKDLELLKEYV